MGGWVGGTGRSQPRITAGERHEGHAGEARSGGDP
jgi:hypothetical protein